MQATSGFEGGRRWGARAVGRLGAGLGAWSSATLLAVGAGAAPPMVPYVAQLTYDSGAVFEGVVDVTVSLHDAEADGATLWGPVAIPAVEVWAGVLSVVLDGAAVPGLEGALAASQVWFEITIDGEVMAPRQAVLSVPYALRAADAGALGGQPASTFATTSGVEAALAAAPSKAPATSSPPEGPVDGQLWFDSAAARLKIYDAAQDAWLDASAAPGAAGGTLAEVSNGALTNQFEVSAPWPDAPLAIPDATADGPGVATTALTIDESAQSILEGLAVSVELGLDAASLLRIELVPPVAGPAIVLHDGPLAPTAHAWTWTASSLPALAPLLGQSPAGAWQLVLTDQDNTLAAPHTGSLTAFSIDYALVRADAAAATGDLTVMGALWPMGEFACDGCVDTDDLRWRGAARGRPAASCADARDSGFQRSGATWIDPDGAGPMVARVVYCEQSLDGGGWALVYNSVIGINTTEFWRIPYAERLSERGRASLDANYYDGSLYVIAAEHAVGVAHYMDVIEGWRGRVAIGILATASGFNPTTMRFVSPAFVGGSTSLYNNQFAAGWSSFDYDGDNNSSSNCAQSYVDVTQHYSSCWSYNLGSDANAPLYAEGVGPHLITSVANVLGLANDGSTYTRVRRISRFVRW